MKKKKREGIMVTVPVAVHSELVRVEFEPKKDITAYELALCMPHLKETIVSKYFIPDEKIKRHFKITEE